MKRLALIVALTFALPAFAQTVASPIATTNAPTVEQPALQEFDLQEYAALAQLIDLAVKSGGMSVAEAGVVLMKKIQANVAILQKKDAPK